MRTCPPQLSTVCSDAEWQEMLAHVQSDVVELRDNRYDQIIHMVSAAVGAEAFYQLTNNAVRSESIEQARELDGKAAQVLYG